MILALDQGTTSTRALLLGPDGAVTPLLSVSHRQHYPAPGRVEHDPAELLANLRACLAAAANVPGLVAVGLANQGESCLAWDEATGAALSPVIVWQDDRTRGTTDRLRAEGAEALTRARAGLPLDPYFSAAKLGLILADNEEAQAAHRRGTLRLGTTDAFFRRHLVGHSATDPTTASRTSLMDLATCRWDADLCALFGVPPETLPAIGPTAGALGSVRVGGREVPLSASVTDQQAALFGHGCRAPGEAKITFGTGAFALAVAGSDLPDAGAALPTVAWACDGEASVYAVDGGVYAAGAAVNWARGLGLFRDRDEIDRFDAAPAIGRGLAFVPALAGLACPHWDRGARGAWMGLGLEHGPADLMQALLEGVAFRMAEVLREVERAVPLRDPVSIDGGMSANPYFTRFLAGALGRPIRVSDQPETTALGTALLAARGARAPVEVAPSGRIVEPGAQPAAWADHFAAARAAVQGFAAARAAVQG